MSRLEQESICLRPADGELDIREDFVGVLPPKKDTGEAIAGRVKDVLIRLNLPLLTSVAVFTIKFYPNSRVNTRVLGKYEPERYYKNLICTWSIYAQ